MESPGRWLLGIFLFFGREAKTHQRQAKIWNWFKNQKECQQFIIVQKFGDNSNLYMRKRMLWPLLQSG
jgi:hypothetical protein